MALAVDAMAERYGKLPTEVLRNASTVDLIIFDVALSYRNHQQRKARGEVDHTSYSQEDLRQAMDRVRSKNEN